MSRKSQVVYACVCKREKRDIVDEYVVSANEKAAEAFRQIVVERCGSRDMNHQARFVVPASGNKLVGWHKDNADANIVYFVITDEGYPKQVVEGLLMKVQWSYRNDKSNFNIGELVDRFNSIGDYAAPAPNLAAMAAQQAAAAQRAGQPTATQARRSSSQFLSRLFSCKKSAPGAVSDPTPMPRLPEMLSVDSDDAVTADSFTLIAASRSGDEQAVRGHLASGANVNEKNIGGVTAMHCAASAAIAKLLVDAGGKIDLPDDTGNTPLHYAALEGKAGVVDYLISEGANPLLKNAEGFRASEIAHRYGQNNLAARIEATEKKSGCMCF